MSTTSSTPHDPRFDTPTPTPELIDEFVNSLGSAFAEARAAGAALEALAAHGAAYLTRAEVRLVLRYGSRAQRAVVEEQPR